ncbi:MAG: ribosome hibernation-promoting factor, HPF/YfiA family [Puniceicoccaceae bacterium]
MKQHDVIISGHNLELTEALKQAVYQKVEKLFAHEERIIRLRVELEYSKNVTGQQEFLAKGHIEISGPLLILTVASHDLYASIDQMADKLDRKLRRRARLSRVKRKNLHSIDLPAELPKAYVA